MVLTEKCEKCKGRGFIEMTSSTAMCKACNGNGLITSKTMKDYFG
jgi:DnaJ-class molecular chaperone